MDNDLILQLYRQPGTVFSVNEIAQIFPNVSYESLRDRLYYLVKVGKLKRLHQGIYTKENYNPFELANKLYKPSYISLETVLRQGGMIFQYYETIFLASYLTREVKIDETTIQYRQIKRGVLTNTEGIESKEGYSIASPERAFLDAVYIYKNYFFDNLDRLNWEKVHALKHIYRNKAFEKNIEDYAKH